MEDTILVPKDFSPILAFVLSMLVSINILFILGYVLVKYNAHMYLYVDAALSPEEMAIAVPSERTIHAECWPCLPPGVMRKDTKEE